MNDITVIVGASRAGCLLGFLLRDLGQQVQFVDDQKVVKVLEHTGIQVTDQYGRCRSMPGEAFQFTTDPSDIRKAKTIWIAGKNWQANQMVDSIKFYLRPSSKVISLVTSPKLNHLLKSKLEPQPVYGVQLEGQITEVRPGQFQHGQLGRAWVSDQLGCEYIESILNTVGFRAERQSRYNELLWSKMILGINNVLSALSGLSYKDELQQSEYRLILANCIVEAIKVVEQAGLDAVKQEGNSLHLLPLILRLPDWAFNMVAGKLAGMDGQIHSSMWEDLEARRKTDIDFTTGELLDLAKQTQVDAPFLEHITYLVQQAEKLGDGSPKLEPEDLVPIPMRYGS